jgi:hypothetical protein
VGACKQFKQALTRILQGYALCCHSKQTHDSMCGFLAIWLDVTGCCYCVCCVFSHLFYLCFQTGKLWLIHIAAHAACEYVQGKQLLVCSYIVGKDWLPSFFNYVDFSKRIAASRAWYGHLECSTVPAY